MCLKWKSIHIFVDVMNMFPVRSVQLHVVVGICCKRNCTSFLELVMKVVCNVGGRSALDVHCKEMPLYRNRCRVSVDFGMLSCFNWCFAHF